MMAKVLPLLVLLVALVLQSCDDVRYDNDPKDRLYQEIYLVPSSEYGNDLSNADPKTIDTIAIGTTARLIAQYYLGNLSIANESIDRYFLRNYWLFGTDTISTPSFEKTFAQAGKQTVQLVGIDYFGDTLTSTIDILVDAPYSVAGTLPANASSPVELGSRNTQVFEWNVGGVEEWNNPQCRISVGSQPDSLWTTEGVSVPCRQPWTLTQTWSDSIYWWSVAIFDAKGQYALSEPLSFRTRNPNATGATLRIPLPKRNSTAPWRITLTDAAGQTLADSSLPAEELLCVLHTLPPGLSSVTVSIPSLPDYPPWKTRVDLVAGQATTTDTAQFVDTTPPTFWLVDNQVPVSDYIAFQGFDGGSGISDVVFATQTETLTSQIIGSTFYFRAPCTSCYISVDAKDVAGNRMGQIYWNLNVANGYVVLDGPYPAVSLTSSAEEP